MSQPVAGTHWGLQCSVTEVSLVPDLHSRILQEPGVSRLNFCHWGLAFTLDHVWLPWPMPAQSLSNYSWCLVGLTRLLCNWSEFAEASPPCSVRVAWGTNTVLFISVWASYKETNRPLKATSCTQKARIGDFWIGRDRLKSNWFKSWFESLVRKSRLNQYFPFKNAFIFYIILMHRLHNSDRDRCGFHF